MNRFTMLAVVVLLALAEHRVIAQSAEEREYSVILHNDDSAAVGLSELAAVYGGTVVDGSAIRVEKARALRLAADPRVRALLPLRASVERGAPVTDAQPVWSGGVTYSYDGAGNIKKIGTDSFAYDEAGRLVLADANGVRQTYEYDAFGNRTDCEHEVGTTAQGPCQSGFTINPQNNHISGASYNGGNVIAFGAHTFAYDALDMMTRDAWGAFAREFVYTADDERLAVHDVGQAWRWTIRDPGGMVLRELASSDDPVNGSWNWTRDYVWRGAALLASRQPVSGSSPTTYFYHLDHLGTPRQITNASGLIVGAHSYHPFGAQAAGSHHEPSASPLKFTGHERDTATTGEAWDTLDYMHARYYAPGMGRFLSVDPEMNPEKIKYEPQQWNRYSYVTNNPLKYTDPDGKDKFMAWLLGDAFRDVSTRDALKGALSPGATVTAINEGRDQFHEDHQQMFRGYSPYPASTTDQVLLPVMMMLGPAGKGAARATLAEAKTLIGKWAADPVKNTISASLRYHFKQHGAEVGSKNMLQYLRSASEFTRNLKGATKHVLDDGKIRYVKNNRYVILDAEGKIVSYGAVR